MRFITKKTSETGKKFADFEKRCEEANKASLDFIKQFGAERFRPGWGCLAGGITSIEMGENPDPKIWRKSFKDTQGEYYPKGNIKAGRELIKQIEALPIVTFKDLNDCVGYYGGLFSHMGFNPTNDQYYGFFMDDKKDFTPPSDCEEITMTKWNELFPEKESSKKAS